ncbi:MAG TPA: DUF4097 family beta strand repeat-containing protein [Acidobacteriaceae bacterium]|nr:DUF4097 family beta strand repeat-containing protein [Acidobacteriaceae bacterium]
MNLRNAVIFTVAFTAGTALAADGNFDKTYSVSGAPTVSISTGSGYVHVYPGSGNQVHIVGHVHSRPGLFGGDADEAVRKIVANPPIVQSGNTITASTPHDESDLFRNITIDYDVTTPAETTLKAGSGSGSIEIGGIQTAVTAHTGSGSIHVDNVGANAQLDTGSGTIRATNVHGGGMLQTGSGGIELSVSGPGDVRAKTGSGSIHVDGVNGGVRAETGSGSIEVSGNPTSEWRASSGSGSIQLNPSADARFNFEGQTGSGGIRVDRPIVMQGSLNRHHVTGTVNGGGPTVRASTGSGGIDVH